MSFPTIHGTIGNWEVCVANRLVIAVLAIATLIAGERAYKGYQFADSYLNRPEPPLGIDNVTYRQWLSPHRIVGYRDYYGADSIVAYCWPNSSKVTFQLCADSGLTFFGPVTVDFRGGNTTSFLYKGEEYGIDFCPEENGYYLTAFFFVHGPGLEVKATLERGGRNCPEEFEYLSVVDSH